MSRKGETEEDLKETLKSLKKKNQECSQGNHWRFGILEEWLILPNSRG